MILQCSESTDFADRRRWESLFLMPEDHLNMPIVRVALSAPRSANMPKKTGEVNMVKVVLPKKWVTNNGEAICGAEV